MTSLITFSLFVVAACVAASPAFYVQHPLSKYMLIYFSQDEITANSKEYRDACGRLHKGYTVEISHKEMNDAVFASYSGDEAFIIGAIGPRADGEFIDYPSYLGDSTVGELEFSNFENETAARSGDFGLVYIDFPNNWWKVAPLMAPRKMRYICETVNRCSYDPCRGYAGQCLVNSTSGWFYCDNNVTSCDEGDVCQNDGTCVDEADSYSCQCREPYSGKHCELYDHCWSNPCQHGATCVGDWYRYHCKCADNFHGRVCEYGG